MPEDAIGGPVGFARHFNRRRNWEDLPMTLYWLTGFMGIP